MANISAFEAVEVVGVVAMPWLFFWELEAVGHGCFAHKEVEVAHGGWLGVLDRGIGCHVYGVVDVVHNDAGVVFV